jgi:hypothetical protein
MDKTEHDVRVVVTNEGTVFIGILDSETKNNVSLTHLHKIILRTGPNNQSLFYEPFPVVFTEFMKKENEPFSFNKSNLLHSDLPFDLDKEVTSENHTFKQVYLLRCGLIEVPPSNLVSNTQSEEITIPRLFE